MDYLEHLIGKSVVSADIGKGELELSDGSTLIFDKEKSECCAWIDLIALNVTGALILSAEEQDDEDETGEGAYRAWVHVVTEAGELNIAETEGNAGTGYYLHGFALSVRVVP